MIYSLFCDVKRIDGVMVSVLASSVVDREFESLSDQSNDYKICICCFSAKHAALREKVKTGWLGCRKMCPGGATCLSVDCCFGGLAQ